MNENDVITASAMVPGETYKSCETDLSYFSQLIEQNGDKTKLKVYMTKSNKWKEVELPGTYKVRGLSPTEVEAFAAITAGKVKPVKAAKAPKAPKDPLAAGQPIVKQHGVVSGKGMIAAWADNIGKFVDQVGGRTMVIDAMKADFPAKHESIDTWVDAYLTYYNTGRFEKQGVPRQTVTKVWVLSDAEKAAGVRTKAPKALGPKVERAPKATEAAPAAAPEADAAPAEPATV